MKANKSEIQALEAEDDMMKLKQSEEKIQALLNDNELIKKESLPLIIHNTPYPQYGQGSPYKYDLVEG